MLVRPHWMRDPYRRPASGASALGRARRAVYLPRMGQYLQHVFVCSIGKSCSKAGGDDVFRAMKRDVRDAGLAGSVRVNKAGCMNQCGHGPMVVVYPQDVWYAAVDEEGGRRIVDRHLAHGEVVDDLRYIAPPGDNKIDDAE